MRNYQKMEDYTLQGTLNTADYDLQPTSYNDYGTNSKKQKHLDEEQRQEGITITTLNFV